MARSLPDRPPMSGAPLARVPILGSAFALILACAGCGGGGGGGSEPTPAPAVPSCSGPGGQAPQTHAYRSLPGVAPALLSLDLTLPRRDAGCPAAPVVVYFHGGGYALGDKSQQVADKAALFNGAGWAFVSANYRLSPWPVALDDPTRVRYPDAQGDAAAALAWVVRQATALGLDRERILLLGHSAGAHLAALIANDGRFIAAQGLPADTVRCAALLDTEAYDVSELVALGGDDAGLYQNGIGTEVAVQREASPLRHVKAGLPPQLVVTRGPAPRQAAAAAYANALRAAGVSSSLLTVDPYSHAEVNQAVGQPGETRLTVPLMDFMRACAAR
jgi:acetyl esterase/lipase